MPAEKRNRLWRWDLLSFVSVLLANILLIVWYYSGLSLHDLEVYFFNADTLYLPSLYVDLFQFGNSIEGWTLNASPNFFPDMGIYFIIMCFTDSLLLAAVIFSIVQYIIISIGILGLTSVLLPERRWLIAALISCLFTPMLFISNAAFVFQFLANAYHLGAFVNTLLAWNLLLRLDRGKVLIWVVLFALVVVAAFSDKLFHVIFTIPALVSWILIERKGGERGWFLVFWVGTAAWLASLLYKGFQSTIGTVFAETLELPRFDLIGSSFEIFWHQFSTYLLETNALSAFILFTFLVLLVVVFFGIRILIAKDKTVGTRALWSLLMPGSMLLVLLTPPMVGSYVGWDSIRYNFAFFTIAPIAAGTYLAYYINGRGAWLIRVVSVLLLAISVTLLVLPNKNERTFADYLEYYPDIVAKTDEKADLLGSRYGIADYWDAKVITMFSKKGLRVYAVFPDLACYEHVANKVWFRQTMEDPNTPAEFRFFIPNHHMPLDSITADEVKMGTVISEDPLIIKTLPFKYVPERRRPVKME